MKAMAESFSDAGVPVFLCDVKGDVSGIATAGVASESMDRRIEDVYKRQGLCSHRDQHGGGSAETGGELCTGQLVQR